MDAGFTCPNHDGTKAWGGCAYCSQEGSISPNQDPNLAIKEQIEKGMGFVTRRYGANQYIVYFQSFTNTYDKPEVLRERFESAFVDPRIVGLSIATRPDCILPENIEVLKEFKKRCKYFSIELGLQTKHQNIDQTSNDRRHRKRQINQREQNTFAAKIKPCNHPRRRHTKNQIERHRNNRRKQR